MPQEANKSNTFWLDGRVVALPQSFVNLGNAPRCNRLGRAGLAALANMQGHSTNEEGIIFKGQRWHNASHAFRFVIHLVLRCPSEVSRNLIPKAQDFGDYAFNILGRKGACCVLTVSNRTNKANVVTRGNGVPMEGTRQQGFGGPINAGEHVKGMNLESWVKVAVDNAFTLRRLVVQEFKPIPKTNQRPKFVGGFFEHVPGDFDFVDMVKDRHRCFFRHGFIPKECLLWTSGRSRKAKSACPQHKTPSYGLGFTPPQSVRWQPHGETLRMSGPPKVLATPGAVLTTTPL